jgi:HEAT repeat protein
MNCSPLVVVVVLLTALSADERRYGDASLDQWRARLADFDAASPRAAEALPALEQILTDRDVDSVTRRAAALAIGRIGRAARPALPTLIKMLGASNRDTEEAAWATKAISLLGPHGREATPALVDALRDESRDYAVRQLALEALSQIGGAHPEAIPAIVATVQSPVRNAEQDMQQTELRQLAVEALGVARAESAVAVPLLARILRSPREMERTRRLAAEALTAIGPNAHFALSALAETLIADDSEAVRDAAAKALGALGKPALPLLQQLLQHDDEGVRWRSADALGTMGEAAAPAIVALRALATDDQETDIVRLHAAQSLWSIDAKADHVWPTAVSLMMSPDRTVRMESVDLLLSLGKQAKLAEPQLREMSRSERREVRQIAEQTLRKLAETAPD